MQRFRSGFLALFASVYVLAALAAFFLRAVSAPAQTPTPTASAPVPDRPTLTRQKSGQRRTAASLASQAATAIQTVQELQNMQNNLAGSYVLANNIDASVTAMSNGGKGFIPIGSAAAPFTGTFNGNGYTITGLFIYSAAANVGLFGSAGATAVIENVQLAGANVTGTSGGGESGATGVLAGHLDGKVMGCTVAGAVSGTSTGNFVGGLVGYSDGSIANSSANITVISPGDGSAGGGLVGLNTGLITGSTATGSVTSPTAGGDLGGLVGANESAGSIMSSQASCAVGGLSSGGINAAVGGLVGYNSAMVSTSHATGSVSGTNGSALGGLVGQNEAGSLLQQSFATGTVSWSGSGGSGGGLVGVNFGAVQKCLATGAVSDSGTGGNAGGLVGDNVGGMIAQSYATGAVSGASGTSIGGLVGDNAGSIAHAYSIGAVEGPTAACSGGLVGCSTSGATSSYWDTQTSFQSASAGGTGETDAQLTSGTLPVGFDPTVWAATSGNYPYLIWLGPAPITGYVNPKYLVMGVTYAPPGPSTNTFVQYQNSSLVGNTQSLSQSFEDSDTLSVTLTQQLKIASVFTGKITAMYSSTASQTTKNTSTVTTMFQVQNGEKTFGTGTYFAPVNHDYDVIWIWLNPAAIFTLYGNVSVVWNGYGFDATDGPDMDIVGIQLGYLNGDLGPIPPQYQASLSRAWAAGQVWPAGQGPALTSADLAQIASADPFSSSTYGPEYIGNVPPSPETPDHRFTLSSCNGNTGFSYNQAAPSSPGAEIYTCTLTYTNTSIQAQEITTSYSQTYSLDTSFSEGGSFSYFGLTFKAMLTDDSKDSTTLTWTTVYDQSITNTATSTSALSVQGPPCGNTVAGQGPCVPVYDSSGNQPTQFDVYQDNMYGTFMFAPVNYYTAAADAPAISILSPNSATAGGAAFTLTANGSGFVTGSAVQWNGTALLTTYVSPTQLTASVSASLIATPGTANVTVSNPGGPTASALAFTINPVAFSLISIAPSSATAGGTAFTLTANGSGFITGSAVQWNGTALSTTYVSPTQLTASVSASLIATPGAANVTVSNPGGIATNALTFTINVTSSGGLTILTPSVLPQGTVGSTYSQGLNATGGVAPYKGWTVGPGSTLPPGLSLTQGILAGTGLLSGTPTSGGTFKFSLQVTDSANATASGQFQLTITGGTLSAAGIVSAASYVGGKVSPGEIVTIFGSFPGPAQLVTLQLNNKGTVSTNLGGTEVLFDGVPAPMTFALQGQVGCVVPYEISGNSSTQVQVSYQGQASNTVAEPVATVVPAIFTANVSGSGEGAIVNQDGTVNSPSNPASVGSIVSVYATGEGQTGPAGTDGTLDSAPLPMPVAQPVTAMVGGVPAAVKYAGGASGEIAGLLQVNIQIPTGATTGSAVPILLNIAGTNSQTGVTVALH
jgi:uncharacterized protein (TIGR03437 family)